MTVTFSSLVLYHAGASAASNYVVAAVDMGVKLMTEAGLKHQVAEKCIVPLVESVLVNFKKVGVPNSLTGPISRGDVNTIKQHLSSIRKASPDLLPHYIAFGLYTIEVALKKGSLDKKGAAQIKRLFKSHV